jgi:hypothetical protein
LFRRTTERINVVKVDMPPGRELLEDINAVRFDRRTGFGVEADSMASYNEIFNTVSVEYE